MIESVPFKFVYEQNKYSLFAQNHFLVKFIFYLLSQSSLKVVEFFLTVFLTEFPSFFFFFVVVADFIFFYVNNTESSDFW